MSKMHVTLSNKRPMWRRGRWQQLRAATLRRNSECDKVSQVNKETKFDLFLVITHSQPSGGVFSKSMPFAVMQEYKARLIFFFF